MPSIPQKRLPLFRGTTLSDFQKAWKAGGIQPEPSGYAGGLTAKKEIALHFASNKIIGERNAFEAATPMILTFKPGIREQVIPVKYSEALFKADPQLALYVRQSVLSPEEAAKAGENLESYWRDTISGAQAYGQEKEYVKKGAIPLKDQLEKVQVVLTKRNLNRFVEQLGPGMMGLMSKAGVLDYGMLDVLHGGPIKITRQNARTLAFLARAVGSRLARQFQGVPLEILYNDEWGGSTQLTLKGSIPLLKTQGEVPKIRREDFAFFLPKRRPTKWGVFTEKGLKQADIWPPVPYGKYFTKPEAEIKAKQTQAELGTEEGSFIVKKLSLKERTWH